MSRKFLVLASSIAMLAACSAAAQSAAVEPSAEPTLLGAELVDPAQQVEILVAEPAPETLAAEPISYAEAITCDIRARDTDNGMLIQARAFADADFDGEYELTIIKSGGGNSSEISQSGPLSLMAGHAATLGENEISVERGAHVRAVLTLYDANGELCRRAVNL